MSQTVTISYNNHVFDFTCHDLGADPYVGDAILNYKMYDGSKTDLWYNHIKPGDLVIDVGANIGWFSKIASLKGADVIAIEPDPKAFGLLKQNCPDVEAYQLCAGNSTDNVKLWLSEENYGDNRTGSVGIECLQNTLDSIVGDRQVAAIKIDTQGWEPNIINGALNTIKNMKWNGLVIMEYWPYGLKINDFDGEFLKEYIKLLPSTTFIHSGDGSVRDMASLDFDEMAKDITDFGDLISIKLSGTKMFNIHENYIHRGYEVYFDDTTLKDEWQKEIYDYAKEIAEQNNYSFIVDFGCGSGYKLINNFNEYNTIGIDVPETLPFLQKTYPDKQWSTMCEVYSGIDIFIASDVIEHMVDPNILIDYIKLCSPKEIIFSTPDRGLMTSVGLSTDNGPPSNPTHVREWNFQEFNDYISTHFDIVEHRISNSQQCTQMIHCRIKNENI